MASVDLFRWGDFRLHSGGQSPFKIDCDALTEGDLEALARYAASLLPPFAFAVGVPTGGLRFAAALQRFATGDAVVIVDDVLSTGASMEDARRRLAQPDALGLVIFARGPCPAWVTPLFRAEESNG